MSRIEEIQDQIEWYSKKIKEYRELICDNYDDEDLEFKIIDTIATYKSRLEELHEELIIYLRTIENKDDCS